MNKKDKDIALFVAFCIEEYGAVKGMTGERVLDLELYKKLSTENTKYWHLGPVDLYKELKMEL